MSQEKLYDRDFLKWTEQQANYLRHGNWTNLDVENLIEELEALGRSEQKELGSYLQVLLMHLLKWQYQPNLRTKSWETTIAHCRDRIQDCLEDTPSLQRLLNDPEWLEKYYRRARRDAAKETALSIETFAIDCPYPIEFILNSKNQFPPELGG